MTDLHSDRWKLPDGVDELLPESAWRLEDLRRRIMDCCHCWGYDLVMPPLIEYLDSLLTGTGETMDLHTFKLIDQQNGRTLGVRADMTPQVARMDAHALRREAPNRLFYTGTVLRARTDGFGGNRSPQQFGAELFGHAGPESDLEIIGLMLDTLNMAGLAANSLMLDLGHVGVYRGLIEMLQLDSDSEASLFNGIQRGSVPDVKLLLQTVDSLNTSQSRDALRLITRLMNLRGDETVLQRAREQLVDSGPAVMRALDSLSFVVAAVRRSHPSITFHIDLAELRGYRYHTGLLFAAYTQSGDELAHGGRYDAIGAAFGQPRPATGFSGDLKRLADLTAKSVRIKKGIFVPEAAIEQAWPTVCELREKKQRVVTALPNSRLTAKSAGCDQTLVLVDGQWLVKDCA